MFSGGWSLSHVPAAPQLSGMAGRLPSNERVMEPPYLQWIEELRLKAEDTNRRKPETGE